LIDFTYRDPLGIHIFQATEASRHSLADVGEISRVKIQVQILAGAEQITVSLFYLVPEDPFPSFVAIAENPDED